MVLRLAALLPSMRAGAGTGINGAIYSELGRNPSFKAGDCFDHRLQRLEPAGHESRPQLVEVQALRRADAAACKVEVVGRSRAPYDVYPLLG